MRLTMQNSPGEYLFALLMAVSPIIGSVWVTPDDTKWTVFSVGCLMVIAVLAVALKPVKKSAPR